MAGYITGAVMILSGYKGKFFGNSHRDKSKTVNVIKKKKTKESAPSLYVCSMEVFMVVMVTKLRGNDKNCKEL